MDKRTQARVGSLPTWGTFQVPFMFYWRGGVPDFKVLDYEKIRQCADRRLCGICGEALGTMCYFVGGPMSLKHRMFHDPPMHRGCAAYAFEVCPYLLGRRDHQVLGPEALAAEGIVTMPVATNVEQVGYLATGQFELRKFGQSLYFAAAPGEVRIWRRGDRAPI